MMLDFGDQSANRKWAPSPVVGGVSQPVVELPAGLYRHYTGVLVQVEGSEWEPGLAKIVLDGQLDACVPYKLVDALDEGRSYVQKVSTFLDVVPGGGGVRYFARSGIDWQGLCPLSAEYWEKFGFDVAGWDWLRSVREGVAGYYHGGWEVEWGLRMAEQAGVELTCEQFLALCFVDLLHFGGGVGMHLEVEQAGKVNGLVFRQANSRWGWVPVEVEDRVVGVLEGVSCLKAEGSTLKRGLDRVAASARLVFDVWQSKWAASGVDFWAWEELLYLEMRHVLGGSEQVRSVADYQSSKVAWLRGEGAGLRSEFSRKRYQYAVKLFTKPVFKELTQWEPLARGNVEQMHALLQLKS